MKRIIAIVIAALMLLSMSALAEQAPSALVCEFENVKIAANVDGQTMEKPLDGLDGFFAIDTADGVAFEGAVNNGDEELLFAIAKLVGDQLHFSMEGLNKTYVTSLPQMAGQDTASLAGNVRSLLPAALEAQLPMIPVISLPRLDITPLVSAFATESANGETRFSISSEVINALVDALINAGGSVAASVPNAEQVLGMLKQMRDMGMSAAIEGVVAESGDAQVASVEIYLVSGGEQSETPIVVLNTTSAQDTFQLDVDLPASDDSPAATIAQLKIGTDPAANTIAASLGIMNNVDIDLAIQNDGALQTIALDATVSGEKVLSFVINYGVDNGEDVFYIGYDIANADAMDLTVRTVKEDDANVGTLEIRISANGAETTITADIAEYLDDVNLDGFTMPAETAPIEELDQAEGQAALQAALQPLSDYFSSLAA